MRAHLRLRHWLLAVIALQAAQAFAGPEARVRVRGSARLEASATATANGFELRGSVVDDAGKPVPDARVRMRLLGRDASLRLLPRAQECGVGNDAPTERPLRGGEEMRATTDASGVFCVRWPEPLLDGRVVVTFDDAGALLDPAELSVNVDRSELIELAFVPLPRTLSLDAPELTLLLESRLKGGAATGAEPLTVEWTRAGAPATLLARAELRPGDTHRLRLDPKSLGGPGTGVLSAVLGDGERSAEARAPVVLTATAELDAPRAVAASSAGDAELDVRVRSRAGVVESGTVEALSSGRTVGIAPVTGGRARVPLRLPATPSTVQVTLRYLPASPWWLAGARHELAVTVSPASFWRRLPWLVGLLAALGWVIAAWRRPRRSERAPNRDETVVSRRPPEPALTWSASGGSAAGWTGVVIDAHDRMPISGARLEIRLDDGSAVRTVSGKAGEFDLVAPSSGVRGGEVRVESTWHSTLERPLPPEGRLSIALVTRRRMLLSRLVAWAERRGPPFSASPEPTPAELARTAEQAQDPDVSRWARAVERAAFGPDDVGAADESQVAALEPEPQRSRPD